MHLVFLTGEMGHLPDQDRELIKIVQLSFHPRNIGLKSLKGSF